MPQRVRLVLINTTKYVAVVEISSNHLNESSIGVFEYTIPSNFFQLTGAGSSMDTFQFYVGDVDQTTWTYGPDVFIIATGSFILRLFQVPVSFATNEASNLQTALDDICSIADQILAAAKQTSDPGHADIGAAAGQLAKALGQAQSAPGIVSAGANVLNKIIQRANSLGAHAAEIITKIEQVVPAIQFMADSSLVCLAAARI